MQHSTGRAPNAEELQFLRRCLELEAHGEYFETWVENPVAERCFDEDWVEAAQRSRS